MKSRVTAGVGAVLLATAIAGVASYATLWVAARALGPNGYAAFGVIWSALYFIIGGLSGVQQELTRAIRTREGDSPEIPSDTVSRRQRLTAGRLVLFGFVLTFPAMMCLTASWAIATFGTDGLGLAWPLALAAASYVCVAVLSGCLYGMHAWSVVAALTGLDAVLRLISLTIASQLTHDDLVLTWAMALPFLVSPLVLSPWIRHVIHGRHVIDVSGRQLLWNVLETVGASVSMSLIVSGFPALLGATAGDIEPTLLGTWVLAITIVRAPIVVIVTSLQSWLVVRFKETSARPARLWALAQGTVVGATSVLTPLAIWLGPLLLPALFGSDYQLGPVAFALLLISSGVIGGLIISSAMMLARGFHRAYLLGWLTAAVTTVIFLLVPLDFHARLALALVLAPLLALFVHMPKVMSLTRTKPMTS